MKRLLSAQAAVFEMHIRTHTLTYIYSAAVRKELRMNIYMIFIHASKEPTPAVYLCMIFV